MQRKFLIISGISGLVAVMLGAFGAHALKATLSLGQLHTFETGVRYQFMHTFALMAIGLLPEKYFSKWASYSGISYCLGIVLFSGSLYLLSVAGWSFMGPVTPLGGLFFMAGWIFFIINLIGKK